MPIITRSFRGTTSAEVRRIVEKAKAAQQAISAELVAAHAAFVAVQARMRASVADSTHGESVLAWRERYGLADGDILMDLGNLMEIINAGGATILSMREDGENGADGPGHVTMIDHAGRTWRVTFAGGVSAFWPVDYRALADAEAQVVGASITDADVRRMVFFVLREAWQMVPHCRRSRCAGLPTMIEPARPTIDKGRRQPEWCMIGPPTMHQYPEGAFDAQHHPK